jgi:hypothetical protein
MDGRLVMELNFESFPPATPPTPMNDLFPFRIPMTSISPCFVLVVNRGRKGEGTITVVCERCFVDLAAGGEGPTRSLHRRAPRSSGVGGGASAVVVE